jgi:type VI secretion system protein ImpM
MTIAAPAAARPAAGWYGKLPTVGDFASRRLDGNFVAAWDGWLSSGLARLRADDPHGWLGAYLASPTWRFLITPGFLPAPLHSGVWAGVVMPSVDRVGRYYPLTLAAPLRAIPGIAQAQVALWSWLQQLEDAAVDALQEDWSIDALELELLRLGLPPDHPGAAPGAAVEAQAAGESSPVSMQSFFSACRSPAPAHSGRGQCCWYSQAEMSAPRFFCSTALDDSVLKLWSHAGQH